jgi:ribonuclease P protein subunit RPR2
MAFRRRGRKGRRTKEMVQIAKERIDILFELAEKEALKGRLDRANRYVHLARKIGMRYNVRVPRKYRMHYCRKCDSFLLPGVNAEYRLNEGKITVRCLNCGTIYRHPYIKEKKERIIREH